MQNLFNYSKKSLSFSIFLAFSQYFFYLCSRITPKGGDGMNRLMIKENL